MESTLKMVPGNPETPKDASELASRAARQIEQARLEIESLMLLDETLSSPEKKASALEALAEKSRSLAELAPESAQDSQNFHDTVQAPAKQIAKAAENLFPGAAADLAKAAETSRASPEAAARLKDALLKASQDFADAAVQERRESKAGKLEQSALDLARAMESVVQASDPSISDRDRSAKIAQAADHLASAAGEELPGDARSAMESAMNTIQKAAKASELGDSASRELT